MKMFKCIFAFLVISFTLGSISTTAQNTDQYKVVINHEEQYSIWPANRKVQRGWQETKVSGDLAKCQKYIEEVWTDMRPLSIKEMNLPQETEYFVVINHEEQYSVWPKKLAVPENWEKTEFSGTLYPCVKYIKKVWTDMRPLSVREMRIERRN